MEDEFLKKLREKYENGKISKETYEDILRRYQEEIKEEEEEEVIQKNAVNTSNESGEDFYGIGEIISRSVSQAMKEVEKSLNEVFPESTRKERGYKCAGSCVLGPGKYDYISAAGSIKITGNVTADRVSVAGALSSQGNIKAKIFKVAGSAKVDGNIIANTVSVAGGFKGLDIVCEDLHLSGGVKCRRVKGEDVVIAGSIVADEIQGEEIRIKIDNSGRIGGSRVGRIAGENIRVECKKGFLRKFTGKLEVKEIRGEKVYIECVSADYVKGKEVIIGDNCLVDKLEAEEMKISKRARVEEVVRK